MKASLHRLIKRIHVLGQETLTDGPKRLNFLFRIRHPFRPARYDMQ